MVIYPSLYDADKIFGQLKENIKAYPSFSVKNQTVVLKPNMVDYNPGKVLTTNPIFLTGVIKLFVYLEAKEIVVADGTANVRDTEYVLNKTGIGKACRDNGVKFVDLNYDDIEPISNTNGFSGIDPFYLPKTIVQADKVISLPKMKCHHWALLTASMKNMFGTVPGKQYGWPKNLLHYKGISRCIIDLMLLIKPDFAIVDGIEAMEGDGPLNGDTVNSKVIVMGDDLASVDATCARIMDIDVNKIPYMKMAGKLVGQTAEDKIKIQGSPISNVKKSFKLPITYLDPSRYLSLGKNQTS